MKSDSKREPTFSPITAGRPRLSSLALAILLSIVASPFPARAVVSLTEMARLEASETVTVDGTRTLFEGYLSLGLVPEAASLLERRVRVGVLPVQAAAPLFEEVVSEQGRFDDPRRLVAVCEAAIRSGVRTPPVLYHYGMGLRGIGGRLGDASAVLAQVGLEEPYRMLALYSLGQIAADRGETDTASDLFRRVEEGSGGVQRGGYLGMRAARSRAELWLAAGKNSEAAPVFMALSQTGGNPLDRIGFSAAGNDPVRSLERLPPETIAGMPLLERVRFLLLLGGLARDAGRYEASADRLARAGKELEEASAAPSLPSPERTGRSGSVESLRRQMDTLRTLRQELSYREPRPDDATRGRVVELLVGLLFADRTISLAAADLHSPGTHEFLSAGQVEEIVRRIEEVSLDGVEVDRLVEQMAATLDTLQNLGHPIGRYRRLIQLEKNQGEIRRLRNRIRDRREAAVASIGAGKEGGVPALLKDVGLFLKELDEIRLAAAETKEFTKLYFDIFRQRKDRVEEGEDPLGGSVRGAIAYADARVTALLPVVRSLEEEDRAAEWDRGKPERSALRAVVRRQLADTLVLQGRRLRGEPGEPAHGDSLAALGRALSLLSGDRLAPGDAADVAVAIGSVLAEGKGRWAPYPGAGADEKEKELIGRVLLLLPREDPSGARREHALYLDAALRLAVHDPGAGAAARMYLEKYPASPLSAGIGVRLGHAAFLAGDVAGAVARYRAAADAGNPEASAVARYMLAWIRFQTGDSDGALRELSRPLSDPSFSCGDPSPFERAVVSLSVRAGKDAAPAQLESYPPVKEGTCAGKVFLAALWEAEEKRGETVRAAEVRDIASRRFPSDANAASLEVETVEALLRAGREGEALSRALTLRGKYGPGSVWAEAQQAPVRDKAAMELAGLFKELGERKFEEGIRTGERSALASSAALMGEYFQLKMEESPDDDGELRLKRAIALLGSGDREGGMLLLEELMEEERGDATGERAAVLYVETMIAGYERREEPAESAEDAAFLILEEHPSVKGVSLALRASSAFLAAKEYGRARSTAEEIEASRFASPDQLREARLIQAEAAVFEGDLAGARDKADLVLAAPPAGDNTGSTTRAKDLYLLSSLKEIDEMAISGNPGGAAAALEGLAARFPGSPEIPLYLLRAMRLYAQAGDGDGAIRMGSLFLKEYPRREEIFEAAGVVGPLLEEKGDFAAAGELYERVAGRFPKNESAPRFLFHAARLGEVHGPAGAASRRFGSWRARYSAPGWQWAYATLFLGLDGWRGGERKNSMRMMEEGLRKVDAGLQGDALWELADLAGEARIAVGDNWAEQFRNTRLVVPLEKSLAIKDRFFRRALAAYGKAGSDAPLEVALKADLLSADLFMEYGQAILSSQRPKGLKGADRDGYEEALKARARSFFERSVEWCTAALDRLEEGNGPSDLAAPIRKRLETAQALLDGAGTMKEGKTQ